MSAASAYKEWTEGDRESMSEIDRAKAYTYANVAGDEKTAMEIIDASEDDDS